MKCKEKVLWWCVAVIVCEWQHISASHALPSKTWPPFDRQAATQPPLVAEGPEKGMKAAWVLRGGTVRRIVATMAEGRDTKSSLIQRKIRRPTRSHIGLHPGVHRTVGVKPPNDLGHRPVCFYSHTLSADDCLSTSRPVLTCKIK